MKKWFWITTVYCSLFTGVFLAIFWGVEFGTPFIGFSIILYGAGILFCPFIRKELFEETPQPK